MSISCNDKIANDTHQQDDCLIHYNYLIICTLNLKKIFVFHDLTDWGRCRKGRSERERERDIVLFVVVVVVTQAH